MPTFEDNLNQISPLPPGFAPVAGLSTGVDPTQLGNALESVAEMPSTLDEEILELSAPGAQNVTLPVPHMGSTHARVRELTGEDEEILFREFSQKQYSGQDFLNLILKQCVVELGDHKPSPAELASMLIGSRTYLGLRIRELTYGPEWELRGMLCKVCGEPFDVAVDLSENPETTDIYVKTWDGNENYTFDMSLRRGTAKVKLVTGEDEDYALKFEELPAQKTAILQRCIVALDGKPVPSNFARNLGVVDREAVIETLGKVSPGPRLGEVFIPCGVNSSRPDHTKENQEYAINLADMFLL